MILKNRNVFNFFLVLKIFSAHFLIASSFDCSTPIENLHHATVVDCKIIGNNLVPVYSLTFRCSEGFEFGFKQTEKTLPTVDGKFDSSVSCSAVGCSLAQIPNQDRIDRRNIEGVLATNFFCDALPHSPDICKPDTSYVEYACKEGYVLDDGYFFVKCLFSSMWDEMPECVKIEEEEEAEKEDETTPAATTQTSTVNNNVEIYTLSKRLSVRANEDTSNQVDNLTTILSNFTTNTTEIIQITNLTTTVVTSSLVDNSIQFSTVNNTTESSLNSTLDTTASFNVNETTSSLLNTTSIVNTTININSTISSDFPSTIGNTTVALNNETNSTDTTASVTTIDLSSGTNSTTLITTSDPTTSNSVIAEQSSPTSTLTPQITTQIVFKSSEFITITELATVTTTSTETLTSTSTATNLTPLITTQIVSTTPEFRTTTELAAVTSTPTETTPIIQVSTTSLLASTEAPTTISPTTSRTSLETLINLPTILFITTTIPTVAATTTIATLPTSNPTEASTTTALLTLPTVPILDPPSTSQAPQLTTQSTFLTKLLSSLGTEDNEINAPTVTTRSVSRSTYNVCFNNYPTPNFFNRSLTQFNFIKHQTIRGVYLEGSNITFSCMFGYNPRNSSAPTITTFCLPSGKWTNITDCKLHPCWEKVPQRPLNGRREVGLILNSLDGSPNGSHVNFTCDQYFELSGGPRQIFCNDGKWNQSDIPKCTLSKDICTDLPPNKTDSSVLLGINGIYLEEELGNGRTNRVKVLLSSMYRCASSDLTFVNQTRKIGFKPSKNPLVFYAYQNSSCIGKNVWEPLPRCFKT